jgi:hypothetical protein
MLASVLYRRNDLPRHTGSHRSHLLDEWLDHMVRRSADTARREFVMPFLDGDVVVQQVDAKYGSCDASVGGLTVPS